MNSNNDTTSWDHKENTNTVAKLQKNMYDQKKEAEQVTAAYRAWIEKCYFYTPQ